MAVLIVHASLGAGHKRAAQALQEVLNVRGVVCECRDLLEFLPGPLPRFYPDAYGFMVTRTRRLWSLLYHTADRLHSPYAPARSRLQRWQFRTFKDFLRLNDFPLIISTHFASSALIADWRKEIGFKGRAVSVITDFVAHRCWKRSGLDHYFVPCSQVADDLSASGIKSEDITVSGIPISLSFSSAKDREEERKKLLCGSNEFLVLVLCSGLSPRKSIRMLEEVRKAGPRIRVLVSAGADPKKESLIRKRFGSDGAFHIFGFSPEIAGMMRAADVLITKPGGLSVSEALATGLPQILLPPIPGQEEGNARYCSSQGAALCVTDNHGAVTEMLRMLIENPSRLHSLGECARKSARPFAAETVIDAVLV